MIGGPGPANYLVRCNNARKEKTESPIREYNEPRSPESARCRRNRNEGGQREGVEVEAGICTWNRASRSGVNPDTVE